MNKIELWFLKRIFKKEVRQDFDHDIKIANLYKLIREACDNEFTEDNTPTMNLFLKERFEESQK